MLPTLLDRRDVERVTGLSRSAIYRMMRAGEFPTPLQVGQQAVRWPEPEVAAWLAERPRATGEAPGPVPTTEQPSAA